MPPVRDKAQVFECTILMPYMICCLRGCNKLELAGWIYYMRKVWQSSYTFHRPTKQKLTGTILHGKFVKRRCHLKVVFNRELRINLPDTESNEREIFSVCCLVSNT